MKSDWEDDIFKIDRREIGSTYSVPIVMGNYVTKELDEDMLKLIERPRNAGTFSAQEIIERELAMAKTPTTNEIRITAPDAKSFGGVLEASVASSSTPGRFEWTVSLTNKDSTLVRADRVCTGNGGELVFTDRSTTHIVQMFAPGTWLTVRLRS